MHALIYRDIALAFRSGGGFGLTLAFFVIVVIFVPLGIGADMEILARVAPGVLWIGAILACLLSLDRLFQLDYEDGTLEALATSPLPVEYTAFAKATAHWLTTGLPLTLLAPVLGYILNLPTEAYVWLIASLLVGTPALSFIGTFAAALTVGIKRGGLLLSVIVLPLYIPTLIFGAQTIIKAIKGTDPMAGFALLGALSLFAIATMPFAAGLALRANIR